MDAGKSTIHGLGEQAGDPEVNAAVQVRMLSAVRTSSCSREVSLLYYSSLQHNVG